MKRDEINQHLNRLKFEIFRFYPEQFIKDLIQIPNDIVFHKHLLKSVSLEDDTIEYLVNLVVNYLSENHRFQRVACLKVLKQIIKNRKSQGYFNKKLTSNFVYLYKEFIFTGSEEIQWAVSVFIKDQILEDDDILWLIDNYKESEHLVNRLLRYPEANCQILKWAEDVYKRGDLLHRQSEVIAILISGKIPNYVSVNSDRLMWAIYYSKCDEKRKEELILKHLDFSEYSAALEVAERLNTSSVVNKLLNHYQELASN